MAPEKINYLQQHLHPDIQLGDCNNCVEILHRSQLHSWPLAAENYRKLKESVKRTLQFSSFSIDV
ncbi:MAG: hypothetical protein K9G70_04550, partial [Prolixibacteraceae bacterium]|nr:hypothetical protein [Prolixibacteraceae bacterium]